MLELSATVLISTATAPSSWERSWPETHERDLQVGKHMRPCGIAHLPAPAILQYSQAHQHRSHCGHGYPSEKTFSGLRSIHSVSTWGNGWRCTDHSPRRISPHSIICPSLRSRCHRLYTRAWPQRPLQQRAEFPQESGFVNDCLGSAPGTRRAKSRARVH